MIRFHHRAVPIALAAVLIDTIGFGIVAPVLPTLIVELAHVGLSDATRIGGYMLIAFAVAQFFAGPVLGNLGDRFGRRPVLLAAMTAFSADYALMALAPTIGWLFLGRVIAGITGATYGPVNAVLADVTPPEKRGATFGLVGAAFGAGFIIGPAIGGLLSTLGPRAPFIAAACLALANAATIALIMPETLPRERRRPFEWKRANVFGAFAPLLHAGGAAPLLMAALMWQIAHMVYPATWSFYAEIALGWDARAIGWSLAAVGATMMLVQILLTGRAIARFGEERTVLIGLAIGVIEFALFVFVTTGWQAYALILGGALTGLIFPSINAILSNRVDASHQGALQGGMASLSSISSIVGPLAMTQALAFGADHGAPGSAFLLAAILAALSLATIWFGVVRRRGALA
ncbi:MAG: MFS transporter [Candidatus Sphingomonas colombiensis]|nr:MFS transporter [Sphingomonas sp.]WEK43477.1 MAG: MFS transporter [Sphingomonas sp.]